jgi:D-threo-aldose 1-dehydrogenase
MMPAPAPMQHRPLGQRGLRVSGLGLGAAPLGGMYQPSSDAAASATVRAALKAGITLFDVAPHYGQGLAERRLGYGLAQMPSDAYAVSTKVGRLLDPAPRPPQSAMWPEALPFTTVYDVSRAGILRSLNDSRARVGRATFEILLLHDPDRHAEDAKTLAHLRDAGQVSGDRSRRQFAGGLPHGAGARGMGLFPSCRQLFGAVSE